MDDDLSEHEELPVLAMAEELGEIAERVDAPVLPDFAFIANLDEMVVIQDEKVPEAMTDDEETEMVIMEQANLDEIAIIQEEVIELLDKEQHTGPEEAGSQGAEGGMEHGDKDEGVPEQLARSVRGGARSRTRLRGTARARSPASRRLPHPKAVRLIRAVNQYMDIEGQVVTAHEVICFKKTSRTPWVEATVTVMTMAYQELWPHWYNFRTSRGKKGSVLLTEDMRWAVLWSTRSQVVHWCKVIAGPNLAGALKRAEFCLASGQFWLVL